MSSVELSSCCFLKRVKCSALLYLQPKQLNLFPRSSQLTVQFSGNDAAQLTSFFTYSSKFGLKEPVVMNYAWHFSQSETEKYFE